MEGKNFGHRFMTTMFQLLRALSFEVDLHGEPMMQNKYHPDFYIRKGDLKAVVETKFYRSRQVSRDVILTASSVLASYDSYNKNHRLLIVSAIVSSALKKEVKDKTGVILWDRSNIALFMAGVPAGDFFLHDFGQFILEAQQGVNTEDPYLDIDEDQADDPEIYFTAPPVLYPHQPDTSFADTIRKAFKAIPTGHEGYVAFEEQCEAALKYLFPDDLSAWNRQLTTDDELSRFDLICKIGSKDDFWNALIHSFHSRYILFEFKNYKEPLPHGQVYTTERYLFPKALRGCCIIIARNGVSDQALKAAKGALRENGKLIVFLDEVELLAMLDKRDNGESPNDFLADKLDDFLMSLSR